jgi:penicillin-binding protein 1A
VAEVADEVVKDIHAESLAPRKTAWSPIETDRLLNARLLAGQVSGAVRRAIAATWRVCKSSRMVQVALILCALPLLFVLLAGAYINFDRENLPDLDGFIRFEPPAMGRIYDANGHVLMALGRERREIVQYKDIPDVLRQAILSAEDKNFFSHSGVDYSVFPRLLSKMNIGNLIARLDGSNREHSARADVFPQGGSTITQELVRGYFLQKRTSAENNATFLHPGMFPRMLSAIVGVPATKQLLLKVEVIRLSLWLEEEMQKRYGSKRRAKEELFARYANFIYLGNGRYGFAAASQFYFDKPIQTFTVDDADKAALLAGITKSPSEYAPTVTGNAKALRRRNQILTLMVANHFLDAETARRSEQAPIRLAAAQDVGSAEVSGAVANVLEELKSPGFGVGSDNAVGQLMEGRIQVVSTIDERIQRVANHALETGLKDYEKRHPRSAGMIQGSVVVLRNSDAAILAEIGGRDVYKSHSAAYTDYDRATQSLRQPGSAMKPILYLAAFRQGALNLDTLVPDEPISVPTTSDGPVKWIVNYDNQFKGMMPARQALAESRNAVAVWVVQQIGIDSLLKTAKNVGIRTKLEPYDSTALGASEVTLLELANAYRFMASGIHVEPHVIDSIAQSGGQAVYSYRPFCCATNESDEGLALIQEGLRGVVRIPLGTAHALDSSDFPIPVMGKTGTTNDFRDALFVGSTYGPTGITVAVRIGFDDSRSLGEEETGARAALPVFREIMLKTYQEHLAGAVPSFPADMEENIDTYLKGELAGKETESFYSPDATKAAAARIDDVSRSSNCALVNRLWCSPRPE